jgi:ribosome recycling factor
MDHEHPSRTEEHPVSDDTPSILKDAEAKMTKSLEVTKDEFTAIRTGRANAAMFQGITAEYYGTPTPLNQLASLQFPEARTVIVTPYDKSAMSALESALRDSDLGVNPTNNGDTLRVVLPALTEDRRKEYVKLARNKAEDGRVSVRASRGNAKKAIEKLVKDKEIGEDEGTRAEKELEVLTKKHIEQIDEALGLKETELETV